MTSSMEFTERDPVTVRTFDTPYARAAAGSQKTLWAGRIISALVILMLLFSGGMKLGKPAAVLEEFTRLGYAEHVAVALGIVEIACAVFYAVPRTSVLGAILLTGYLGGATATHVRIADPFIGPVLLGVAVWLGLYLRDSRLRALLPLRSLAGTSRGNPES